MQPLVICSLIESECNRLIRKENNMNYSMMSYSLARQGFNPCEIIKATSELGLKWIDWLSTYDENPRILYNRCEEAGIKISALYFFST